MHPRWSGRRKPTKLRNSAIKDEGAERIPDADRQDFIRAFESGKTDEASRILNRKSFKENMFLGKESAARIHSSAEFHGNSARAAVAKNLKTVTTAPEETTEAAKNADLDLSAINLDGLTLDSSDRQPVSVEIPNGKDSGPKGQSARGG